MTNISVRETSHLEIQDVLSLYPLAFPDEELRPVVSQLLEDAADVISLAAFKEDNLIGHILFTLCSAREGEKDGALLAPLGVAPSAQRSGVGSALVRAGLERLENAGVRQVFVLGDPEYYSRFGFIKESEILAPYDIPPEWAEAWRSKQLAARPKLGAGRLKLPEPWLDPALWSA